MITRERLEELIKEGATIYSTSWKEEVKLGVNCEIQSWGDRYGNILVVHEDDDHSPTYSLDSLDEDIETAKFKEKFSNITRTERLHLPMWEEIYEDLKDKEEGDYVVAECGDISLEYERNYTIDQILLFSKYEKFNWNATKENYIKACRLCKKLFLGEDE